LMATDAVKLTVVLECYARGCRWNSDHKVPNDGRPWMNRCLLAAAGMMPKIGSDGNCTERERVV